MSSSTLPAKNDAARPDVWKILRTHSANHLTNMPRLNVNVNGHGDADLLVIVPKRARRIFDGFIDFATQGNILEIAFGLM